MINVKEIEELIDELRCGVGDIMGITTTLDALLAFYKESVEQEPFIVDEPYYSYEAMGCGLEDRNITDRYEAMKHGWDCAIERMFEQVPKEPLYTHPPASAARIAELEVEVEIARLKNASLIRDSETYGPEKLAAQKAQWKSAEYAVQVAALTEKLRIALDALLAWQTLDLDEEMWGRTLAALGEK